jgi:2,4-dienoyl-CoA reductase-like NADH-dependent reductase (Old Yellow Enzyme family)
METNGNSYGNPHRNALGLNPMALESGVQNEHVGDVFRPTTSVALIVTTGFDKTKANATFEGGRAGQVAFKVLCMENPDHVERSGAVLKKAESPTLYGGRLKDYTDYPALPV